MLVVPGAARNRVVNRSSITKAEARARARDQLGTRLRREEAFVDLAAEWLLGMEAVRRAVERMYALDFSRAEIARRLDVPLRRVPKVEELGGDGTDARTGEVAEPAGGVSGGVPEQAADSSSSGEESGDH